MPADNDLRNAIIQEAHAVRACGHVGMIVTLDRLSPWCHWKHLFASVNHASAVSRQTCPRTAEILPKSTRDV